MTFSIVARDLATGAFGVATATAGPMVGALVPHTRQGYGAAASQAMTNPYLAMDALALLDREPADTALSAALATDRDADRRQVVLVDGQGRTAGWTGAQCTGFAGHLLADNVAVAGNMLAGQSVLDDMLAGYREALPLGLAPALLQAMRKGAAAGGDSRGLSSAALRVHRDQTFAEIDLRVDLSSHPLELLGDLLDHAMSGSYAEFFATLPRR